MKIITPLIIIFTVLLLQIIQCCSFVKNTPPEINVIPRSILKKRQRQKSKKKNEICKNLRVRSKILIKNTKRPKTKSAIITNLSNIIKDDLANDVLYMLKFYNLSNDEENSYFYIILYELISIAIKDNNDKFKELPVTFSNIVLYITVKNVILHNILHHGF
tara:strand:+ start:6759 stop:7241 length:483 start_codon:yes stop_codon:yes gene_type:complete